MKITKRQIRQIIREELIREAGEDVDFDISKTDIKIPAFMKKMLDPDVSPAKYATLDQKVDEDDKPEHQAIALVAFALSYADEDEAAAKKILTKAVAMLPKVMKAKAKASKEG